MRTPWVWHQQIPPPHGDVSPCFRTHPRRGLLDRSLLGTRHDLQVSCCGTVTLPPSRLPHAQSLLSAGASKTKPTLITRSHFPGSQKKCASQVRQCFDIHPFLTFSHALPPNQTKAQGIAVQRQAVAPQVRRCCGCRPTENGRNPHLVWEGKKIQQGSPCQACWCLLKFSSGRLGDLHLFRAQNAKTGGPGQY